MKKNTVIIMYLLIAIIVGAVGFYLFGLPLIDIDLSLQREKRVSTSVAVLERVRDILNLNTVEMVYKVVFPYDFVPADMNWTLFLKQHRESRRMSPLEIGYLETYTLCNEIGIQLERKKNEFVVVTTIIKGGFDLSSLAEHYVIVGDQNGITITMPRAIVTDFIIEDTGSEMYSYPDIDIDPERWQKISAFIQKRMINTAVSGGILQFAEENGKQFIERFFLDAGYSSVNFLE